MNCLSNRATNWAVYILAFVVMREYVSTRNAMRDLTLLILALGNVLPKTFHPGTMRGDRAFAIFVRAFSGVT